MTEELNPLFKNHIWDLVDFHLGKSMVWCKWIVKIKTCSNGIVERYKTLLSAKRFTQD
jgi:hypothetical protein